MRSGVGMIAECRWWELRSFEGSLFLSPVRKVWRTSEKAGESRRLIENGHAIHDQQSQKPFTDLQNEESRCSGQEKKLRCVKTLSPFCSRIPFFGVVVVRVIMPYIKSRWGCCGHVPFSVFKNHDGPIQAVVRCFRNWEVDGDYFPIYIYTRVG